MMKKGFVLLTFIVCCLSGFPLYAQEGKDQGPPPAMVVVADVTSGFIAPENEFVGSVFYRETSSVASEVSGLTEKVNFEEGQRVKKGYVLVEISSDLLEKTIQSTQANYEQVLSDLENETKHLERAENLYKENLISARSYDDQKYNVKGLERKAAALQAEVERLEVELSKKAVRSPFDGIVVKKHAQRGEWLSSGSVVATIARDDSVDIVAEVPEEIIRFVKTGMGARVTAGGTETAGKVVAIVPRADISTRTIPVKVRVTNTASLIEGMVARVILPSGEKEKTFILPRDAVIKNMSGETVIFAVLESQAKMIPVRIVGYSGMTAGVLAEGITEGIKVVIKGNERLRDGQPVRIENRE